VAFCNFVGLSPGTNNQDRSSSGLSISVDQ
jgi:hypothetical protein